MILEKLFEHLSNGGATFATMASACLEYDTRHPAAGEGTTSGAQRREREG
jgi:hypothetical protein